MPEGIDLDANPWWPLIRGAFRIPHFVSDENAMQVIARRMIDETANIEPAFVPAQSSSWSATFEPGLAHVRSFLAASAAGELDLPLCNFGDISFVGGATVPYVAVPRAVAIGALLARLTVPAHQPWITWLWTGFYNHATKHAFDPEGRERGTTRA